VPRPITSISSILAPEEPMAVDHDSVVWFVGAVSEVSAEAGTTPVPTIGVAAKTGAVPREAAP